MFKILARKLCALITKLCIGICKEAARSNFTSFYRYRHSGAKLAAAGAFILFSLKGITQAAVHTALGY